jgi:hypothetical protein
MVSYVKPQPIALGPIDGVQGPGELPAELWAKSIEELWGKSTDSIEVAKRNLIEAAKAVRAVGQTCSYLYVLTHALPQVDRILELAFKSTFPKWVQDPKDEWTTRLIGYGGKVLEERRVRFHM